MKIVYDNYNHGSSCKSLWGFSAYIEKYKLLFDTGSNGRILLENINKLSIDVTEIESLFITHSHWDHVGGIDTILELNDQLTLFVPNTLSKHLIKDLKTLTKKVVVCGETPVEVEKGVYSTGLLGVDIPEQSLIIDDDFPKVITGCGHFGIENIITKSQNIINKEIKMAIGGFHLLEKTHNEIITSVKALQQLGIEKVIPTHCTGDMAIELYKEAFGDHYIEGGVGKQINIFNVNE